MARFYTSTDNSRGNAVTAMSHKGQNTHTRGWHGGIRVRSFASGDRDIFDVYTTGGSCDSSDTRRIGRLEVFADGHTAWTDLTIPAPISEGEGSLVLVEAHTSSA